MLGNIVGVLPPPPTLVTPLNVVPAILTDKNYTLNNGELSDIAPTILKMFSIEIPKEMTGKPLV